MSSWCEKVVELVEMLLWGLLVINPTADSSSRDRPTASRTRDTCRYRDLLLVASCFPFRMCRGLSVLTPVGDRTAGFNRVVKASRATGLCGPGPSWQLAA